MKRKEMVEWVYGEVYSSRRDLECRRCGAWVDHLTAGICTRCLVAINTERASKRWLS